LVLLLLVLKLADGWADKTSPLHGIWGFHGGGNLDHSRVGPDTM
jgi:hypothetical protein